MAEGDAPNDPSPDPQKVHITWAYEVDRLRYERDRYRQALVTLSRYDDGLRASNWSGLANIVKEALSDQ